MKTQSIVATNGCTLKPGDNTWSNVETLGKLTVYDRTALEELVPCCREAELLIVNKTPVRDASMAQLPRLR